jgi:uridine phosphorylase
MESSTLFVVGAARDLRCGACFHVIWNQEREKLGLPQTEDLDTSAAVRVAVRAMRLVIERDRVKPPRMPKEYV